MDLQRDCPCGSGTAYDGCCGRLHRGAAQALTAEELMRSRYSAYARGAEALMYYYPLLDRAPKGRNEGDSPEPWMRRHDEYA